MIETTPLVSLVQKYIERDVVDAAHFFETMSEKDALHIIKVLPVSASASLLEKLQVHFASTLIRNLEPSLFTLIASKVDPQFFATIFMHFPSESQQRLLQYIPQTLKAQIAETISFPENSIGRFMSRNFLSFLKDMTVSEAISKIRSLAKKGFPPSYVYVINAEKKLVGVVNMRDLMLGALDEPLEKVMRKDLFSLHCFTDREDAANELSKRKYFAAPVLDSQNRILGIISAEQLLQGMQDEVTEDLHIMFGAGGDERTFSPISFSLKKRLPWLHVNLATAFLASGVVASFEGLIAKITLLAVFLPVVAGQGSNAGAQSLAIVMRGLVMREIPKNKIFSLILKEGTIGIINGIIIGIVTAFVAWLWCANPYMGLVIGLGMLANLIVAGLSGASIPLVMKAIGLDPAQSSIIILTTITDVMGILAFLGFALLFQNYLL